MKEKKFKDIFKEGKQIVIPDIQRDYVQGRQDPKTKKIINKFLCNISQITPSLEKYDFNFIYGVIENEKFIPVDGQQRLTLLFLLYWYEYFKSDKHSDKDYDFLTRFTYDLRDSSRDFLKELTKKENVKELCNKKDKNLSNRIKDSNWFLFDWLQDPTINSILYVLDQIDEKFKDDTELSNKLDKISFLYEEVKADHEDLYIKLNSRGKPLDNFENFKANLIAQIQADSSYDNFINNLESWTEIFENLCENENNDDNEKLEDLIQKTDNYYLRFLVGSLVCQHYYSKQEDDNYIKNIALGFTSPEREDFNILANVFETLNFLKNNKEEYKKYFSEKLRFKTEINNNIDSYEKLSYTFQFKHLLYLAVLLKAPKDDKTNCQDFISFFTKMIENSPSVDDNFASFQRALHSIFKIADKNENIYNHIIKSNDSELKGFDCNQYSEEIVKAKCSGTLLEKIRNVEERTKDYLDGNLASLLVFSSETENMDLPTSPEDIDEKKFDLYSKLLEIILQVLDNTNKEFLVKRALLTKGNYLLRNKKGNLAYFLKKKDRDYSWKNFLSQTHKRERNYMKILLDDLTQKGNFNKLELISQDKVEKYLKDIINQSNKQDWRKYFIEDDFYIKESAGCIKLGDDINLQGNRTSHYYNYYMLVLSKKLGCKNFDSIKGEQASFTYNDYSIELGDRRYIEEKYFKIKKGDKEICLKDISDSNLKNIITEIENLIYRIELKPIQEHYSLKKFKVEDVLKDVRGMFNNNNILYKITWVLEN